MSHHHGARKFWTQARLFELMGQIELGRSDSQIAEHFGTSIAAIRIQRKRAGIPPLTKTVLNSRSAARMLGLGCSKSVSRWVANGWLCGRQGPVRRAANRQWLIKESDLLRFLEDPDHWHRWKPERIPDAALREWATELRAGVRFLTLTEAAQLAFVEPKTVYNWIVKGWIPGFRNGNHLVREADLLNFINNQSRWHGAQRKASQ